jgi:hypothetical protein
MVRLIKRTMNVEIDIRLIWVPDGAVKEGPMKEALAWVELPPELPPYGSEAFRETRLDMYVRLPFLDESIHDQAAIVIAHELSHIVLESIGHPLRKCEKAVDLTAMLLGFRRLYVLGSHKARRLQNGIQIRDLGYLTQDEVKLANRLLARDHLHRTWASIKRVFART